jgi:hypothetical protein
MEMRMSARLCFCFCLCICSLLGASSFLVFLLWKSKIVEEKQY